MENNAPQPNEQAPMPAPQAAVPPPHTKELTLPKAIVLAAVILGVALIIVKFAQVPGNSSTGTQEAAGAQPTTAQYIAGVLSTKGNIALAPVTAADHAIGNTTNPKVTIVEYSDLECPYCKVFQGTLQQIISTYGTNVEWVYRHFPLDCDDNPSPECQTLHSKARGEAIAAECANAQGGNTAFWKYIDQIFSVTPSNNQLDPTVLTATAQGLGLNMTAFNACVADKTYANVVTADATDGVKIGVQATPTSIIIDDRTGATYKLEGAYPEAVVAGVLDALLK